MVKSVRKLVVLGVSNPACCFAKRIQAAGVDTFFIDLLQKGERFNRSTRAQPQAVSLDISLFNTSEGIFAVKSFVNRVHADAIISADDWILSLLGKSRAEFEPNCIVLAPNPSSLEKMWDKIEQINIARSSGFEVLPSFVLSSHADIGAIPDSAFPVVIRPSYINSTQPSFKAKVLNNQDELAIFYNSVRWTHTPIVQSFRLAPNYILHGVRSKSGDILDLRLFKAYRKYRGFCTSMVPMPLSEYIELPARRFIEQSNIIGPFHFDFLGCEKEGKAYFLEVNIRLGGTTGKVIELGFDEPGLTLAAFNAHTPFPLPPLCNHLRATSLGLNLTQIWNDLCNRRDQLAYPQLPRFQSILAGLYEIFFVHHG
jgi:biotin carboxylase